MLVAAMNPCPCGYYPDMNRCKCSPTEIHRYLHKISRPLLDRIDICVDAPAVSWKEMTGNRRGKTSRELRQMVTRTQEIQRKRYEDLKIGHNSDLSPGEVRQFCHLTKKAYSIMEQAYVSLDLSARNYHRILKVARTIADMEEADDINEIHLSEALSYRVADQKYWRREL
jgi:magnesium chelatase family protein